MDFLRHSSQFESNFINWIRPIDKIFITITISFLFHFFFNSFEVSRYFSNFSLLQNVFCCLRKWKNSIQKKFSCLQRDKDTSCDLEWMIHLNFVIFSIFIFRINLGFRIYYELTQSKVKMVCVITNGIFFFTLLSYLLLYSFDNNLL